jgi:poly(3-hydroxybutyrate) depolymerase
VQYTSVDETMARWRERNQCDDADPTVTVTGDTTCTAWSCAAPTELCLIEAFAHQWPGGIHSAETDANATGALFEFFSAATPPSAPTLPAD